MIFVPAPGNPFQQSSKVFQLIQTGPGINNFQKSLAADILCQEGITPGAFQQVPENQPVIRSV